MATSVADKRYQKGKWVSTAHKLFSVAQRETILEPKKTALFIVDMQNGFRLPDAPLLQRLKQVAPEDYNYYMERLKIVVPNLRRLQEFFRKNKLEAVQCIGRSLTEDGRDRERTSRENFHTPLNSKYLRIQDELAPEPNELVLTKTTASMFAGYNTYNVLQHMGIEYLVFGGCVTDGCVLATANDAGDFFGVSRVVVVEDCCITYSENDHVAAIRQMGGLKCIASTDSVINHLAGQMKSG